MDGVDLSALGTNFDAWGVLWALLSFIVGWIASIFAARGALAAFRRTPNVTESGALIASRIARYGTLFLGIGIGLSFLGASIQPVLAAALIVVAVLAIALRGIADNFASGIILQTRNPARVGDEVEFDDESGTVLELNGRALIMRTFDGRTIHIPNSSFLQAPIVNNSKHGTRRSEVQVRASLGDGIDVDQVAEAVTDAATAVTGDHGEVRALVVSLSPERVTLTLQFWHASDTGVTTSSDIVREVSRALAALGTAATVTSDPGRPPFVPSDEV